MMKWLFKKICVPLMLINDNVYTFISGIVISLATNIFTTLFMEKDKWHFINSWHMYLSVLLYLFAGGLGIPLVKQIGKGGKLIAVFALRVHIVQYGDKADAGFGVEDFLIPAYADMLPPEAAQILCGDAVDLAGLHIVHHPLKIRTLEIRPAPSVIHIFAYDVQAVLAGILPEDGALRFNAHAVAVVFVITAQSHV